MGRTSPSLAGTLITSLVMVSTASDVYVALGGDVSTPDSSAGPCVTNTQNQGDRGLQRLHHGSLGCMALPAAARCSGLISAKYVTCQAGECLSSLAEVGLDFLVSRRAGRGLGRVSATPHPAERG